MRVLAWKKLYKPAPNTMISLEFVIESAQAEGVPLKGVGSLNVLLMLKGAGEAGFGW